MLLNCGVGEVSLESPGLQGDPTSQTKGNQSRLFIGRSDIETETPIYWPPEIKLPTSAGSWKKQEPTNLKISE